MNEKTRVTTPRRTGRVSRRRRRRKLRIAIASGRSCRRCWQGGRRGPHSKIFGKLVGQPAGKSTHEVSEAFHRFRGQLLEVVSGSRDFFPFLIGTGSSVQHPVNSGEQITTGDFDAGGDDA